MKAITQLSVGMYHQYDRFGDRLLGGVSLSQSQLFQIALDLDAVVDHDVAILVDRDSHAEIVKGLTRGKQLAPFCVQHTVDLLVEPYTI